MWWLILCVNFTRHWIAQIVAAAAAKSLQTCPTLCDPIDGSPPGSSIPGILKARILEWVAISFFNAWKWKVKVSHSVVSDSSRPQGLQPTRLLHPWDFPGKSTGGGAVAFSNIKICFLLCYPGNVYYHNAVNIYYSNEILQVLIWLC